MYTAILLALVASTLAVEKVKVAGGWAEQKVDNPEFIGYAWDHAAPAISQHESNNGEVALVPVKLLTVKTQVVAGRNIDLEIEVGPSKCPKSTAKLTATACPAEANAATEIYVVRIFDQPWTQTFKVTSVEKKDKSA